MWYNFNTQEWDSGPSDFNDSTTFIPYIPNFGGDVARNFFKCLVGMGQTPQEAYINTLLEVTQKKEERK